ncbi:MAG: glycogen synthase GlgA [Candidatus Omnitrophica bacterium]|nr:glycogen synthase GlgA [Candidatus Omnitrophota bacterium]
MKVAFCASEVAPFAKTGGLADVAGALPLALEKLGHEVIIIMPGYKSVHQAKLEIKKLNKHISYANIGKAIKVYFIESDKYFHRSNLYCDKHGDYKDNLERFAYYCKESLNLLKEINFPADIIHIHDWQASLIPVYLKAFFRQDNFYKNIKTVLTIHNLGYQGIFPKEEFPKLGLDWPYFGMDGLEFFGKINLLKAGLIFSDIINTVSPTYSREIQSEELGFGLEGILSGRKDSLYGILNGLDYNYWSPETDKYILKNYSLKSIEDKLVNKLELQKICGFKQDGNIPVLGIVSRLAEQKGFDILAEDFESICKLGTQFVVLGIGEHRYHVLLEKMTQEYPQSISVHLEFNEALAHKVYAGSDVFLMPSQYEPCGLGQMIALRYGALPLVFKTGGLADTVNSQNGFIFEDYNKEDLLGTVKKATEVFQDKKKRLGLVKNAMQCDFSWDVSAKKYIELYEKAKSK